MTSLDERVRKIWDTLCWDLEEWTDIDGTKDRSGRFIKNKLTGFIAAEIRAAVEEEKVKLFEGEDCCVAALEHDMYLKGKSEAYADAAKILAEQSSWCADHCNPGDACDCLGKAEKQVRARAGELK